MAFIEDSFTDTDGTSLAAHAPDSGGVWTVEGGTLTIESGGVASTSFGSGYATNDATPPTADYDVSAIVHYGVGFGGQKVAVFGRGVCAPNPYLTEGYVAYWDEGAGAWTLSRFNGGGETVLDTYADASFTSGTKTMTLSMVGDSLELLVDTVPRCSATDSSITAAQLAGLYIRDGLTGTPSLDNFVAGGGSLLPPGTHEVSGRGFVYIGGDPWLSVTIEATLPFEFGKAEPPNYYHVGMISWGTANGTMTAHPITRLVELVQIPPDMEVLYYQFAATVTATIVELAAP